MRGYYQGNPAHNVKIRIWNVSLEQWDDFTGAANDFPSAGSDQTYIFAFPGDSSNYIDNDIVRIKIIHVSAGNATHLFHINQIILRDEQSSSSSST